MTVKDTQWTYKVDGVKHVYCSICLPDFQWIRQMEAANRLTDFEVTDEPCESCGSEPRYAKAQSKEVVEWKNTNPVKPWSPS